MPTNLGPLDLTSNTSHPPFVTSASTVANGGFQEWMAFDGTQADGWAGSNNGVDWLQIDLGTAQLLGSYSIAKIPTQGYIPTAWTMQGSNDGTTWTVVDTRIGENAWYPNEIRTYICAVHTTAYRYFRINITANAGGEYTMIGELGLYSETTGGTPPQAGPPVLISPTDLTSNTSHPPFVTSGLNEYDPAYGAFSAGGSWLSTQLPAWLQIDLGVATVLGRYVMTCDGTRSPKDWTVQGSNDGSTWTVVDTQAGIIFGSNESRAYYAAVQTSAYRYFRVYVTAEQGTESIAQINHLYLYLGASTATTAQTITFPAIANHVSTDPSFAVSPATASSGLAVGYSISGPATLSGLTVTLTGPGTVTIQASQGGDGTYLPATPVNQSFSSTAPIDLAPHDLTSDTSHTPFVVSASSAYSFLPEWHAFDGTATYWIGIGGGVDWLQIDLGSAKVLGAYAILATTELARMPKNWTMQGSNDGATWAVLDTQAGQAWTNNETLTFRVPVVSAAYRYYRLNITANNGDGTYTDIGELYLYQGTIVGGLTAQTITFPAISNGAANDPPFVLIGTSDSGLPLSYSVVSGLATISGNTVTITGVGPVTIQAAQGGNGSYSAATPVTRSFTVAPGQRGNIAYDQIKASDRTGNGNQLLTYSLAPASATSPGTPGQVAFDAAGYWYFCYGLNQWGRIGPTGYGSAAASPPSW